MHLLCQILAGSSNITGVESQRLAVDDITKVFRNRKAAHMKTVGLGRNSAYDRKITFTRFLPVMVEAVSTPAMSAPPTPARHTSAPVR